MNKIILSWVFLVTLVACGRPPSSPLAEKKVYAAGSSTLLETVVNQGVPRAVATLAFSKYDSFAPLIQRNDNLAIIDFTVYSGNRRFFMIDTATGRVQFWHVAHGAGSDPQGTGTPTLFSNIPESHMSSLGSYLVSETYQMKGNGTAARMDGLEKSNSLARQRGIVMHSAAYVSDTLTKMGMSWGCPAISLAVIAEALQRLTGGAFLFAFGPPQARTFDGLELQRMMLDPSYNWSDESLAPASGVW